jgi:hypothetical protein
VGRALGRLLWAKTTSRSHVGIWERSFGAARQDMLPRMSFLPPRALGGVQASRVWACRSQPYYMLLSEARLPDASRFWLALDTQPLPSPKL